MLRIAPGLTLALFLGPLGAGLAGTLLPSFGYLPALGGGGFSLQPWRDLLAAPGLAASIRATLVSGIGSTVACLGLTVLAFAALHDTRALRRLRAVVAPLLAVPHAASAVGLAFLIAPSGWLARLVSPWPSGWATPPDLLVLQDPLGLALLLGLVVKETPFLLLVTFAALAQTRAESQLRAARALGYGPARAWLVVVLPQVYPQIRLPLMAVLAYGLGVVDMALVLGPTTPPTLSVLVLRWFQDRDLGLRFQAAAGAVLQLLLVVGAILLWQVAERVALWLARPLATIGGRGGTGRAPRALAGLATGLLLGFSGLALAALLVWSFAQVWRFPAVWPQAFDLEIWARQGMGLLRLGSTTAVIGLIATAVALALVVACLENEDRATVRPGPWALRLLYLPLLVPQIAFLFGVQVLLVRLGLDGHLAAVVLAHLLFVLPYVFLVLADPWRALDPRYGRAARMLGKGPAGVLFRIKLPMLLRPLALAAAIGFSVSVAQYLPTLFAGAGRHPTLTTETLALAHAGDRRVVGALALILALLPLAAFALALLIPAWRLRDRRGLAGGV